MIETDLELLGRYVDGGDREALNTLFSRHYPAVYHTLLKLVPQEAAARDLAQETFLRAFRSAGTLQDSRKFRTWLLTIAVNQARQHWRSPRPPEVHPELEALVADVKQATPDALAGRRELERALERALQELPEKERIPLVLHFYERLSLAEIAEVLEVSKPVVRHRCESGIARLRRRFHKEGRAALLAALLAAYPSLDPALASALSAPPGAAGTLAAGLGLFAAKPAWAAVLVLALAGLLAAVVAARRGRNETAVAKPIASRVPEATAPSHPSDAPEGARPTGAPTAEAAPSETIRSRGPGRIVGSALRLSDYRPVPGVAIRVVPASGAFENRAASAEDGTFVCRELPLGETYTLLLTRPDLGYVEVTDVTLDEQQPTADVGALLLQPGRALSGIVRDASGAPVPGALVRAGNASWEAAHGGGNLTRIALGLSTRTDAEGRFSLSPLSPGHHDVQVGKEGYSRRDLKDFRVADGMDELEVVLTPGGEMAGQVLDEGGQPIRGATVLFGQADRYELFGQKMLREHLEVPTRTDADGRFRFTGLPGAGDSGLKVSAAGYLTVLIDRVSPGTPAKIVLRTVEGHSRVELRILDAGSGSPILPADTRLRLVRTSDASGAAERYEGRPDDRSGTLVFAGVPPGAYHVQGRIPGYKLEALQLEATIGPSLHDVRAAPISEDRRFMLGGVVVDARTSLPIAGARVRYVRDLQALTNADGAYALEIWDAEPGVTFVDSLRVAAPGYHDRVLDLSFPPSGRELRLDVALDASGALQEVAGRVVGREGRPVPGAEVEMEVLDGGEIRSVHRRTGPDGRFRIERLRPDALREPVRFRVRHPAHPLHTFRESRAQARLGVTLTLGGGETMSGRVVDVRGAPVARAIVLATLPDDEGDFFDPFRQHMAPDENRRVATARCDDHGRFELPSLPREKLLILPSAPGCSVAQTLYPHGYLATPGDGRSITLRMERR